ncbi:MAG: HAD hydrolase-like protein, partial [Actinomycetota bacterium]
RAGMRSLLVLTGVTGPDELLRAAPDERPDLVCADLEGLCRPPAVAQRVAGAWECGDSRAEVVDGALHVGGAGDPVDALRAAAAAAWDAADSGRPWTATPDLLARLRTVVGRRR